ncbi:MAG: hypothetical protein U9N12_07520 [Euryarchaeota archaeon]|nr:hypothetical protein [Euryarchaeota archaeon]
MTREAREHGAVTTGFSDNSAVSTVVGAILILGLLVTVTAFVGVYYVPPWVEDDEARHAQDVFVDFSSIPGHIDELVLANNTDAVSKQRIKLGGGDIPIAALGKSWGSLGVVPHEGNFTVKANVWAENITYDENNSRADAGGNITKVHEIYLFQIYIPPKPFGYIYINLTNSSGRVVIDVHADYIISTWDGDGNKIIDEMLITTERSKATLINLLSPCYGFSKVLDDADTPYNITITTTLTRGLNISYGTKYSEYIKVPHTKTSNGTLIYKSMNRRFLDQKFIYQNGAVFLCQPPNVTMRIAPDITIENATNGIARILIPMVTVGTGVNRTPVISGSGTEELQMRLDHTDRITFADGNNTENVSIIIEPPEGSREFRKNYLQEWADYFEALVKGPPIVAKHDWSSDGNYTNVNITLSGKIHLELKDIEIEGKIATVT